MNDTAELREIKACIRERLIGFEAELSVANGRPMTPIERELIFEFIRTCNHKLSEVETRINVDDAIELCHRCVEYLTKSRY